jgi:DNA-directed RNA polymerase subunit RPC12/RpoP
VSPNQAQQFASAVTEFLFARGILSDKLSDNTLGEHGYAPGKNSVEVIEGNDFEFLQFQVNGVEIITEKTVFHNGENGIESINCPSCGYDIIEEDWGTAIDEWMTDTELSSISCPNCKTANSITDYNFNPTWGFGNFGITFWNWPELKKSFIRELENIFGRPVKFINGHL